MAKTSTRRVTIFINGKEVEASVKQTQTITSSLTNIQKQENSHEYLHVTATFSLFCIMTDEIKAHEASTMGFRWKVSEYGAQNSEENKRDYLKKAITLVHDIFSPRPI